MKRDSFFRIGSLPQRGKEKQRGMTLIEFLVGMTIGLLVILAAVASLLIVRDSSRTMSDSAALEQQATLAMLQIGRQLSQAGAYNAFAVGTSPSGGAATFSSDTGEIQFDTRPIGVAQDNALGTNFPLSTFAIFGTNGATGTPPTATTDTLYISYGTANDGSPSNSCMDSTVAGLSSATDPLYAQYGVAAGRTVSVFSVATGTTSLTCDTDPPSDTGALSIAANVIDMRVAYLVVAANGDVTYYQNAQAVTDAAIAAHNADPTAANTWVTVNGVQVCLELVGDFTQAGSQTLKQPDCQGNTRTVDDRRLHRIVRNTFYLRNPLQAS